MLKAIHPPTRLYSVGSRRTLELKIIVAKTNLKEIMGLIDLHSSIPGLRKENLSANDYNGKPSQFDLVQVGHANQKTGSCERRNGSAFRHPGRLVSRLHLRS